MALLMIFYLPEIKANTEDDYLLYHTSVRKAEELIAEESFDLALQRYQQLFKTYSFVFLRDYKVATQLALHLNKRELAYNWLQLGIANGWTMNSIRSNKFLKELRTGDRWASIKNKYDSLHTIYLTRIDLGLRSEINKMFKRDQSKALGALFKLSSKGQDKYAERKFAPANEIQVKRLDQLLDGSGYPGERLIGNDYWAQTIISHHNSISQEYCKHRTMYHDMRPKLFAAVQAGEMAPHELAIMDDWFTTVESGWQTPSYGYLADLNEENLLKANHLRVKIGLRKIETRNGLIDVQQKTGINFYLPAWPKKNGKIHLTR